MAFFIFDISTTLFDKTKFDEERLIAFAWFLDARLLFNHTDRLFTFLTAFILYCVGSSSKISTESYVSEYLQF